MTVTENKAFGYSEKEMEELVRRTYPRMIQYVRHVLNSGVTVAEDVIMCSQGFLSRNRAS